ncbi:MAG: hypothetical protein M0Q42_05035 [Xanthomonadales bacterium]|nr:hypothetical protein [Xanthomonadales bacterium]
MLIARAWRGKQAATRSCTVPIQYLPPVGGRANPGDTAASTMMRQRPSCKAG